MEFETIIGLEVHAQLLTRSKMYCGCSAAYAAAEPNTHVCPVCLGLPGALPVINHDAVIDTVMTGLALNCTIPSFCKFDRKNYIYPDLMKGYQISQYDLPLCVEGYLDFVVEGAAQHVGIRRVHLEEDTARLVHRTVAGESFSLVDVNRSGVPLMEIVTDPDLRSPEVARLLLIGLRQILRYIGVSTGNMEEGAFRVDANISQRTVDGSLVGAKVEIKNMNSFRAVERALAYEVERQREILSSGGRIEQETRGWDDARGVTLGQRSKEYAHDYRYFPEPDLPPLTLSPAEVSEIAARMPELPRARAERFVAAYALAPAEAALLTEERAVADYYEATVAGEPRFARPAATWISGELFALMRERGLGIEAINVSPARLRRLIELVEQGTINLRTAKGVLLAVEETGAEPEAIVRERGLAQVSDVARLEQIIREVIDHNPDAVADYHGGKQAAAGFLIGQVMKQMRGTANPSVARQLLTDLLDHARTEVDTD
ncbi:MAG TPA: Asp-tRNA(Asn)/Glu-tRNA(Gln) amidotransferase subunit GatB [Thermomicrobiaceae bacterium]|nr:Asp-tRNA(Asn)/Glu-tRNA(Gln) amidotransferase subunit GatB [Thermomicrobiaceae bacterium]